MFSPRTIADILTLTPRRTRMARKTIFVSDFSSKTVKYGDGRRGVVVADAHVDDKVVQDIAKVGRPQARRGRRPKTEA
jgi:hypothetical protein